MQYGESPIDEDARNFLTGRYRDIQTKGEPRSVDEERTFDGMLRQL